MEILPFNFKNYKIRTFTDEAGNIWFVAKDIADVLEIKNVSDAVKDFDDDEKSDIVLNYDGSTSGKALVLSESGLYSLIMRSRKAIAKPFQKWVTKKVLPSIRKTGSYSISQTPNLQKIEERAKLIALSRDVFFNFKDVFLELGITRPEELAITCNRAVKEETEIDFLKIAKKEAVETEENFITVTELCEIVRKGDFSDEVKASVSTKDLSKPNPRKLNLMLQEKGFQTRNEKVWEATEKGKPFADFVQNKSKTSEKTVYHLTWKKEVLEDIF